MKNINELATKGIEHAIRNKIEETWNLQNHIRTVHRPGGIEEPLYEEKNTWRNGKRKCCPKANRRKK
jgi:hypothetical protein